MSWKHDFLNFAFYGTDCDGNNNNCWTLYIVVEGRGDRYKWAFERRSKDPIYLKVLLEERAAEIILFYEIWYRIAMPFQQY